MKDDVSVALRIKRVYAALLYRTGLVGWKIRASAGRRAAILMYHRVLPSDEVTGLIQPGMYVSPEVLEAHIRFLRDHFEIVPLSVLGDRWYETSGAKPLCALTFDDGWWDFYRFAYPLFLKERVPATVFLPTDYVGTPRWFWTDELGEILDHLSTAGMSVTSRDLSDFDPQIQSIIQARIFGVDARERLFTLLKGLPADRICKMLNQLSELIDFRPPNRKRAFLTWQEVREMFASGYITFGSHTASHALLTTVSDQSVHVEMTASKEALLSHGVADVEHMILSYPNGNHSPTIARLARETGYRMAVVTQRGWLVPNADPYMIKRIAIHQDISESAAMFGARISGLI